MATGRVLWFNNSKGYGFIGREDGGDDVFVHATGVPHGCGSLKEGDKVAFEVMIGRGGKQQAANIRLIT
jgi:cold shock CspA family protein